jgi:hypothetical protein
MPIDDLHDDLWLLEFPDQGAPSPAPVEIETLEGVVPLDRQFGAESPKSVPESLSDALFGASSDRHGTPVRLYAILDAALVPNLAQFLEASGLPHECLIRGDSFAELEDVAPWIVQINEANAFTRRLFTHDPDAPWSFWNKDAALFVRSAASLADVSRHFRKLLRIEDQQGRWFFFRFWAHCTLVDYLQEAQESPSSAVLPFFASRREQIIDALICTKAPGTAYICRLSHAATAEVTQQKGWIDAGIVKDLALMAHVRNFVSDFHRSTGHTPTSEQVQQDFETSKLVVRHFVSLGFKSRYHLGSFVYWTLFTKARFDTLSPVIQQACQATPYDPNLRFVAMAREIKRLFAGRVRNHHGG